jgi:phosphate:Na+ symporter
MEDNWVAMMLFGLLGGLGLFLLGMNMMSQGLMKSAGDKMRSILSNLTKNRFFAVGLGTFVTMIIQSSSATTVMLISFVNAGLMKFAQTLGIILGADIGTTITAQMIAFKLTDYALLMIAIGFAVKTIPKNEKVQYIGEGILGFGILFFGMHIMSESMVPLRTYEPFINLILHLESPVTGILIGALFTALIQSSSAFIGIMIVLATQGLLSIEAGVPLLLGANIGTAVTAFLASMNTSREAKKVAVAHTLFKLVGLLLVVWWIPDFIRLVKYISPVTDNAGQLADLSKELPRQIANAHTLFNVIVTAVSLPFVNTLARFINFLLPEQAPKKRVLSAIYLRDDADMPPSLALNLAKQEVNHLASIVQEMTSRFIDPFIKKEKPDLVWMQEREEEVDFLRDNITSYVLKLASGNIKKERINEAFEMLYTVKEFEQIADLVSTTYMNKSVKWIKSDYMFSEEGRGELIEYHQQVLKQLNRAIEAFKDYNLETARLMHEKHQKYRKVAVELQRNHYNRLAAFIENSINSSKTHLELMTVLATIYSHSTNVARVILQISNGGENNEG